MDNQTFSENKIKNISAEKLRIAMVKDGNVKLSELAKRINCSAPNMTNKFKRNNFSENDLRIIADALGYTVEIVLISKTDGERI